MTYPLSMIEDLDEEQATALRALGIRTTEKLLEAAKAGGGRTGQLRGFPRSIGAWRRWAAIFRFSPHGACHAGEDAFQ